jgi:FtsH-binding integral membrane protein
MLNGITLSVIFAVYELGSIVILFVVSAVLYGALALIGYRTKHDLSSWKPYLGVFLLAGIVLTVVNLFLKNGTFDLILDWFILILFFGITIYDINKMKAFQADETLDHEKIHIYCAMQLYLDFINIFLRILSLFGKKRN